MFSGWAISTTLVGLHRLAKVLQIKQSSLLLWPGAPLCRLTLLQYFPRPDARTLRIVARLQTRVLSEPERDKGTVPGFGTVLVLLKRTLC